MIHTVLESLHNDSIELLRSELSFRSDARDVERDWLDRPRSLRIEADRHQQVIAVLGAHVVGALDEAGEPVAALPLDDVPPRWIEDEDRRPRPQVRRKGALRKLDLQCARQRIKRRL